MPLLRFMFKMLYNVHKCVDIQQTSNVSRAKNTQMRSLLSVLSLPQQMSPSHYHPLLNQLWELKMTSPCVPQAIATHLPQSHIRLAYQMPTHFSISVFCGSPMAFGGAQLLAQGEIQPFYPSYSYAFETTILWNLPHIQHVEVQSIQNGRGKTIKHEHSVTSWLMFHATRVNNL